MSKTIKTRGIPPNRTIYTEGVDPIVVQLRTEQVAQELSDYALGLATGIGPSVLGKLWRGTAPTLAVLRKIEAHLRIANPSFAITHTP